MWEQFFYKLAGIGLIKFSVKVLPAAIAFIFVAFKNLHPNESPERKDAISDEYASEQVEKRYKVKKNRYKDLILLLVFLPAIFAILSILTEWPIGVQEFGNWIIFFILYFLLLCIPILLKAPYTRNLTGKISTKDTDYLLKTIFPFCFFLRAFHTDVYSSNSEDPSIFSEDILAKKFKHKFIRFYSVGNPREIDSPNGSTRVYAVNDWETNVNAILHRKKAKHIYFRVSSSDGCFKEFKMLQDVLEKTTLIVDRLGLPDYNELRKVYSYLPSLEPITGLYVYLLHKDAYGNWVAERCSTLIRYNRGTKKVFRERMIEYLLAFVMFLIFGFIVINIPSKSAKETWIESNLKTCPIIVDSALTIQHCEFPLSGLIIEASISDNAINSVTEEQAISCFFHLNQCDFNNLRECIKIIKSGSHGYLRVVVRGEENNELVCYEYHQDADFERLWTICHEITMKQLMEKQKGKGKSAQYSRQHLEDLRSRMRAR